jgi:putative multiple sugar transport system substrate-binding protein
MTVGAVVALSLAACGSDKKKTESSSTSSAAAASSTAAASSAPASSTAAASSPAAGASSSAPAAGGGGKVGVSMPTKESERWIADGDNVKKTLEGLGYTVDLQYADNKIPDQVSQIENMIQGGAKALVIAAIDGTTLTGTLQKAADAKIAVIAYDRLIRDSDNVDYYATFDNFKVGVIQATSLVDGLTASACKPCNIELFAGSPDDNNAKFFFDGGMSVLQPKIDSKDYVVKSGQTDFAKVAILRWEGKVAQARMDDLLSKSYTGAKVDGVLSPYDGLSRGIISALQSGGYGTGDKKLSVVTGQDAEVDSVKSIIAGEQYSTVFKDTRKLADVASKMVDAVLKGGKPEINNTKDYDNGKKVVPSFLLDPVSVDKTNYKQILIDESHYYTEDKLK